MLDFGTFVFDNFAWDPVNRRISLRYILQDSASGKAPVHFTETIDLPMDRALSKCDRGALNRALFALHMIGGISYYKTCCPKNISVRSGTLTVDQAVFWKDVYENGLGEFFYRNNIDFRDLLRFPATAERPRQVQKLPPPPPAGEAALVPIGGGKDSIVTIELLKAAQIPVTLFRMGSHPIIDQIAKAAGLPLLTVQRTLSPELLELNTRGALNGHVPITAYVSFLTVAVSVLYGYRTVVMSNEESANTGSLMFFGKEINHQWSKSLAFEHMLQEQLETIAPGMRHFSLLRPLSELSIVKLFTLVPAYLSLATSCNTNWKIAVEKRAAKRWCGECPKCAFVFALYAAFLPKAKLIEIFGTNFYESDDLLLTYRQLLGLEGTKPFECVGTPEETRAAFLLAHSRGDMKATAAMKMFIAESLPQITDPKKCIRTALKPQPEHAIPPEYSTIVPDPSQLA